MKARIKPVSMGEVSESVKTLARDTFTTSLWAYVVYSVILHVVVVGIFSIGLLLPEKSEAETAKETAVAKDADQPADTDARRTPTDSGTEAGKPKGTEGDYYKRAGLETAKPDEIPKNPFEAKEELDKAVKELE